MKDNKLERLVNEKQGEIEELTRDIVDSLVAKIERLEEENSELEDEIENLQRQIREGDNQIIH